MPKPIPVKGSPYFHYEFTIKGIRYRGSTGLKKKKDAQTYIDNERRKVLLGESDKTTRTLETAFVKYEDEHSQFLASYASIQAHVDHLLGHFGKNKPLHDIGQNDMEQYIATCRTETYTRKPGGKAKRISNANINRRLATFQGMHRRARDSWRVSVQPIDFKALRLKEKTFIDNTLKESDVQKLWDAAPEHIKHFIMISLYTGWRASNVLSLRGEQIHLDTMTLQTIGKRGKLITSPITDELHHYIITNKLHEKKIVCAQIFKRTGEHREVKRIKTAWDSLFERTKIKRIRVHDLRHTFGTWLYLKTGDQRLVQEMLHHSDIKTSMRYTHTKQNLQREKLNKATTLKIKQVGVAK